MPMPMECQNLKMFCEVRPSLTDVDAHPTNANASTDNHKD